MDGRRIPSDPLSRALGAAMTERIGIARRQHFSFGARAAAAPSAFDVCPGRLQTASARTIRWSSEGSLLRMQVTPDAPGHPARVRRDGEAVGLIGTTLLAQVVMTIDFPRRHVVLRLVEDR